MSSMFRCNLCPKTVSNRQKLETHVASHLQERPYKCDGCTSDFKTICGLRTHQKIQHKESLGFPCDKCHKVYKFARSLKLHIQSIHEGLKPFKCELCPSSFKQSGNLTDHMTIHTGERPFRCDICDKSFSCRQHLRRHLKIHSSITYSCILCTQKFKRPNLENYHVYKHTREKPYFCGVCNREFQSKSGLDYHKEVHSAVPVSRNFQCLQCGKAFRTIQHLSCHVARHSKPGNRSRGDGVRRGDNKSTTR